MPSTLQTPTCQDKLDSRQARWRSSKPVKPSVLHMPPSNTADLDPGSPEMPSQFFHLEPSQTESKPPHQSTSRLSRYLTKKRTHITRKKPSSKATTTKQQPASPSRRATLGFTGSIAVPPEPHRSRGATSQIRHPAPAADRRPCPALLPCPVPIVRWPAGAAAENRKSKQGNRSSPTDGRTGGCSSGCSLSYTFSHRVCGCTNNLEEFVGPLA